MAGKSYGNVARVVDPAGNVASTTGMLTIQTASPPYIDTAKPPVIPSDQSPIESSPALLTVAAPPPRFASPDLDGRFDAAGEGSEMVTFANTSHGNTTKTNTHEETSNIL